MADAPRDPLAEHPLGLDPSRKKARSRTLELFPDVGETPLSAGDPAEKKKSGARVQPGAVKGSEAEEFDDPGEPLADLPGRAGESGSREKAGAAFSDLSDLPDLSGLSGLPGSSDLSGEIDSSGEAIAFARRVAAGLADLLILALVGAVELAAGALLLELRFPPAALMGLGAFLLLAALVLLVLGPFVWGTTPGMALADLRIRGEDGGSPSLTAAFVRFIGFFLTGLLAGVPLLIAAFDRRGRTLSDLLSRTTIAPAESREGSGPSPL